MFTAQYFVQSKGTDDVLSSCGSGQVFPNKPKIKINKPEVKWADSWLIHWTVLVMSSCIISPKWKPQELVATFTTSVCLGKKSSLQTVLVEFQLTSSVTHTDEQSHSLRRKAAAVKQGLWLLVQWYFIFIITQYYISSHIHICPDHWHKQRWTTCLLTSSHWTNMKAKYPGYPRDHTPLEFFLKIAKQWIEMHLRGCSWLVSFSFYVLRIVPAKKTLTTTGVLFLYRKDSCPSQVFKSVWIQLLKLKFTAGTLSTQYWFLYV